MGPFNQPINSGDEYANLLIERIRSIEESLPIDQKQPVELMNYWEVAIREKAITAHTDYIIGQREHFLLNDKEMIVTFQEAMSLYVNDLLGNLVEKDMLDVSVSEDGDLLYGLSDKGKEYVANNDTMTEPKKKRGRPKKQ